MTVEFAPERIVEVLDRHDVLYIVVGGYAARLHGAHRPTKDIDIAPSTEYANLERLARALRELNAGIRIDDADDALPFSCTAESLRGMQMLNLRTAAGDLDLTFAPAGFENGYVDLLPNAVPATVGPVTVKLADLRDVIKSKMTAGRDKDLDALPELNKIARQRIQMQRRSLTRDDSDDRGVEL